MQASLDGPVAQVVYVAARAATDAGASPRQASVLVAVAARRVAQVFAVCNTEAAESKVGDAISSPWGPP
eukprot:8834803-Lingulodinium_polyedra.AAC.1